MVFPNWEQMIWPNVAPDVQERNNETVAKKYAERFKNELRSVFENGIAHYDRGKPADRYQAWVQGTLDTVLIQNSRKTIQDMVVMGQLDPMMAQTQLAQLVDVEAQRREELARLMGNWDTYRENVRTKVFPYPGSQMWGLLFEEPDYVVDWAIADFEETYKAQVERNERRTESAIGTSY